MGSWVTTITMLHPEAEAGTTSKAVGTYRWRPGEKVLVHEVEAKTGKSVGQELPFKLSEFHAL